MVDIEQNRCLGYSYFTDCGIEYDCGYDTVVVCDDCTFVVAHESGDGRRGKKPWAKCNNDERRRTPLAKGIPEDDQKPL